MREQSLTTPAGPTAPWKQTYANGQYRPIVLKNPANHHRSGLSEGTAR